MSIDDHRFRPGRAELETAAYWHLLIEDFAGRIPADEANRLREWLAASPLNVQALRQIQRTAAVAGSSHVGAGLAEVAREARRQRADRIVPGRRRGYGIAAALVGIVSLVAITLTVIPKPVPHDDTHTIQTDIGQRKVVKLEDGSQLTLDQGTVVVLDFQEHRRLVRLDKGQARFAVAHDATRPFVVAAGGQSIVALGTEFNIETSGAGVSVFLRTGKVAVAPLEQGAGAREYRAADDKSVVLAPGNKLDIYSDGRRKLRQNVDWRDALAWEQGRLVVTDETLGTAVARLNRYGAPQVRIDDPALAEMRISGVFSVGDRGGFLEAVSELLPVKVERTGDVAHLRCRAKERCRA